MKISPFFFDLPKKSHRVIPIFVSVPHCGTEIPENLMKQFCVDKQILLEDTDWQVNELCNFVPDIGGRRIYAKMSRMVVDLNRSIDDKPLYADPKRLKTGLIPETTFAGQSVYKEIPDLNEKSLRLQKYYIPYHQMLEQQLKELSLIHKNYLLLELHSIKRFVPKIYPEPLPDFMLGNRDGISSNPKLIKLAQEILSDSGKRSVAVNNPFKGGEITRKYGDPQKGQHTLQLEMSQDIYLDSEKGILKPEASAIIELIKEMVVTLCRALEDVK